MAWRCSFLLAGFLGLGMLACSGSHAVADGGDAVGADGGDAIDGADGPDRDAGGGGCLSAADCGGYPCDRVAGWGFCEQPPVVPATGCTQPGYDECCTSADCTVQPGGGCYWGVRRSCGGPVMIERNTCEYDLCQTDADCGSGVVCLPAWVTGNPRRTCLAAACRADGDCGARPGGACVPFGDPCCGGGVSTMSCSYPGDPCSPVDSSRPCAGGASCVPSPTGGLCQFVPCPL